ncbi:MAG: hypothetical protein J5476_07210 [Lachnospiraceae bacterium]|nr:hypothetical protein [Lachnospiraceae bacterium]
MKICRRAIECIQVINDDGDVRVCGWLKDGGIVGRLAEQSMSEIYNGAHAKQIKEMHLNGDYSNCNPNACPYVANNEVDDHSLELDELPKYPPSLFLAYENVCNYHCVMCTIPDCQKKMDMEEHERKMDKIDAEIRKVLPHVRKISANGLGELFASKHILQLLSEWKPEADASDCSVSLETNGSLFNSNNWEKISNLGQYNLSVSITILSFDPVKYQELSGTSLPVDNLINNLYFVKSLREQGIINRLELATVYQDANFRELPEFARRCIEEFGADYVRLRPFEPWRDPDMKEWMRDVRNEYNPYHKEFLEVMKDPIFKHPKVHDWGGGKVSGLGPEPYPRMRARYNLIEKILNDNSFIDRLKERVDTGSIAIYGMHLVGRTLVNHLRNDFDIPYCIDKAMDGKSFGNVPIYGTYDLRKFEKNTTVIISLDQNENAVKDLLIREGYSSILLIRDLVK